MSEFKPKNGNVLFDPNTNIQKSVFQESDNRRDCQFGIVLAVCEGSELKKGDTLVYNPRNITSIEFEGKVYKVVHENNIIATI